MSVREMALKVLNWIHLDQDRFQEWPFVNTVMNLGIL
jgi:hypothetical protein